jgi:hypothetical protein
VAVHTFVEGHRQRIVDPDHLAGITGVGRRSAAQDLGRPLPADLLRPLTEYEALVGGSF